MDTMRNLVIGIGNVDREDDGVAYAIVNGLRRRLGQELLDEPEACPEEQAGPIDSISVMQLAPELLDLATGYDRLIFVDAHVQPDLEEVHCAPVRPEYSAAAFTHHMTPAMFLALLQALYQRQPAAWLVSVRGHEFEFVHGLSEATAASVAPAVEWIVRIANGDWRLAIGDC
jgi:hydrogenase maturation protease